MTDNRTHRLYRPDDKPPKSTRRLVAAYSKHLVAPQRRRIAYQEAATAPIQQLHPYIRIILQGLADELNPFQAAETILAMLALGVPLLLELSADHQAVELGLFCHRDHVELVSRALRGILPQVELTIPEDYPCPPATTYCYSCLLDSPNRPDIAPLRDLGSYQTDPLQAVLEALMPLRAGESVRIHYSIAFPSAERLKKAEGELYSHINPFLAFLLRVPSGPYARFEPSLQRKLEERLTFPVAVTIKVSLVGAERTRLQSRARSLYSVFASRFTTGADGIYLEPWRWRVPEPLPSPPTDQDSRGLLLNLGELASCWHLPSSAVTSPGVSFLKYPPAQLPTALLSATGLTLGVTCYRGETIPIRLPYQDLHSSHLVFPAGQTGTGKSTALSNICADLIRSAHQPALIVLDPHGTLARQMAACIVPPEQVEHSYLVEFGDVDEPIGIPIFKKPLGISLDAFIQVTFQTFRLIFAEQWSSTRMADTVHALVSVLCSVEGTLDQAPRLLTNPAFRRKLLSRINDPTTLEWWEWYESRSPSIQSQIAAPVITRLRSLFRSRAVRAILARTDGIQLSELIDQPTKLFFSFAGNDIQSEADTLGELLIARLHLEIMARFTRPLDSLRRTYVVIDESQRYKGDSLRVLLSESRKAKATLLLATQYIGQWDPNLLSAILGNVAHKLCFRCGVEESSLLAKAFKPFSAEQLEKLDNHECAVSLQIGGSPVPSFPMRTLPLNYHEQPDILEALRANARKRFGRPRDEIERGLLDTPPPEYQETDDVEED